MDDDDRFDVTYPEFLTQREAMWLVATLLVIAAFLCVAFG